jgi:uncharacterized linocin/CFP29 family protein
MDFLRQSLAPITDKAWEFINEEAKETLTATLTGREFVDVEGPKGIGFASVPLGQLDVPKNQEKGKVHYGVHKVMPLIELRMPFELDIWELDNVVRGNEAINVDNLIDAAKQIAKFEEDVIYKGFKPAHIKGLIESSEHRKFQLEGNYEKLCDILSQAIIAFKQEGIEGEFNLVVGNELYQYINSYNKGYPTKKLVESIINGNIILSESIEGGLLVARRGGDFRLTLGQDMSIGYETHDTKKVQLYFTESFTFQVLDPAAVIVLQ